MKGIAILDNDGRRILANYYDPEAFPSIKEEKAFERSLFNKTHKANGEIIMLDGLTCLYRSNVDLFFYVMGSCHENEVMHDENRVFRERSPCTLFGAPSHTSLRGSSEGRKLDATV